MVNEDGIWQDLTRLEKIKVCEAIGSMDDDLRVKSEKLRMKINAGKTKSFSLGEGAIDRQHDLEINLKQRQVLRGAYNKLCISSLSDSNITHEGVVKNLASLKR